MLKSWLSFSLSHGRFHDLKENRGVKSLLFFLSCRSICPILIPLEQKGFLLLTLMGKGSGPIMDYFRVFSFAHFTLLLAEYRTSLRSVFQSLMFPYNNWGGEWLEVLNLWGWQMFKWAWLPPFYFLADTDSKYYPNHWIRRIWLTWEFVTV